MPVAETELVTLQAAVSATGNGSAMDVSGDSVVGVQITGTFSATVTFEASVDGTNWVAVEAVSLTDGSKVSSATAPGLFFVPIPGVALLRTPVAWTSGTSVTVVGRAQPAVGISLVDVSLSTGDIALGAVEIKDATSDDRALVDDAVPGGTAFGLATREIPTTGTLSDGIEVAVVGAAAVQVLAANAARKAVLITNVGANIVRVGNSTVTATTGLAKLVPGASVVLEQPFCPTVALFAVRETADSTVLVAEIA